jgi:hypothetical protein
MRGSGIGKGAFGLIGSFVLCMALGWVLTPDTWQRVFAAWKFLAVFIFGFIVGKIFHE